MFSVEHHVFFHLPEGTSQTLQALLDGQTEIIDALHAVLERQLLLTPELQRLTDEVAQNRTVTQSAVTLIGGLAQQIRDNANDAAAMNALADELDASERELASAVSANTPSTPGGGGGTPPSDGGGTTPGDGGTTPTPGAPV